jgi:RNA polymerase sigma-70 factor, ECF subfamily
LESDLIRRASEGDHDAYEELMRMHQDLVFRLACLIVGDTDEAEDIAQETFIRAYQQLHRFDLERPFRPWVLRISTNLARNRLRSVGRYMNLLRRAFTISETPSVDSLHTQAWESQALYEAVRQLSRDDQEVIYLRYILELSVQETADTLQIEVGTVKSRLSRALKRLRGVVLRDFPLLYEGRQL